MTKDLFLDTLKQNKWFIEPQLLIDYRLPVVQYYMKNKTNSVFILNDTLISSREVNIVYNKNMDFCLLNEAYESILKQYKEGKLK
jgi:hypothetical protein